MTLVTPVTMIRPSTVTMRPSTVTMRPGTAPPLLLVTRGVMTVMTGSAATPAGHLQTQTAPSSADLAQR